MILLTGGSGLLGRELRRIIPDLNAPNRNQLDITNPKGLRNYKLIVHAAAYTDVLKAEKEKKICYLINVLGTRKMASFKIPMLYISTEYVFDGEKGDYCEEDYPHPVNFYSLTKLLGEYESRNTRSVVIRCLFKPRPFEHPAACEDQFTTGDYVDRIAEKIAWCIVHFDRLPETLHVGSRKRSTWELAYESNPDVSKTFLERMPVHLPRDTSLNLTKWRKLTHEY